MFKLIKKYRQLFSNFSYLSVAQFSNIIFQIIAFPYLIRVLGTTNYGLTVFAESIVIYLSIIINFGFDITATKAISLNRNNKKKLDEITSSIYIIKLALFFIGMVAMILLTIFVPFFQQNKILLFLTLWKCIYEILFPLWFFQGLEKMKYIALLTLISRILFLILIFIFIKVDSDYLYVPAINLFSTLLCGIIALWIVFVKHNIKFYIPKYSILKNYFSDSLPIFLSNLSTRLYVSTNKVVIGSIIGMSAVSFYDLAEKIIAVLKIPQKILGQVIFPKISIDHDRLFIKKLFFKSILFNLFLTGLVMISSEKIILLLGGDAMLDTIPILKILLVTVPIIAMGNVFGIKLLLPFGFNKDFSRIVISSLVFYLLLLIISKYLLILNIYNLAWILVLTEIFTTTYMYLRCRKHKLWI